MATDIATRELRSPIDLAEYLFRRIHEVGVRTVHGVPGKSLSIPARYYYWMLLLTTLFTFQVTTTLQLWITCQSAVSLGQAIVMSSMLV